MSDVRERIQALLDREPVVLFMKGTRLAPRCGFSARAVDVLDEILEDYVTVDVLEDEELREGVKAFGQWPTFPQLYVRGQLIGGADIMQQMHESGELAAVLGAAGPRPVRVPEVSVTDAAIAAFRRYAEGDPKPAVRLAIDRGFDAELDLAPPREDDVVIDLGSIVLAMDRASARRADGIRIDFVEGPRGTGFRVENPNAPPRVKSMSVEELDRLRKSGKPHLLLDVRTEAERGIACIEGSVPLDEPMRARLEDLDRSTTLVLHCHHGMRSRVAAEHCIRMGFRDVWNLEGGIDAWSVRIDPSVPRY